MVNTTMAWRRIRYSVVARCAGIAGGLVLALGLAFPGPARAVDESIACSGEPTSMGIAYGHVVACAIDIVGDSDLFQFSGLSGQRVVVQATRRSGGTPCLALTAPDATPVGSQVCDATAARIDTVLTQTGAYTITVSEQGNNETMPYTLALESVRPRSPYFSQGTEYGLTITDEINPVGDLDVLAFRGTTGDVVSVNVTPQSGTACLELFAPDGTPIGTEDCSAATATINTTLTQTGTHTVLVSEQSNAATMAYTAIVSCTSGTCTTPTLTQTVGVFRPGTVNNFFLRNSNTPSSPILPDFYIPFGSVDDVPVVGDLDGNGTTTIGVYRPSTSTFYLRNSNTQGWADVVVPFGDTGDIPLLGDWDGNGTFTVGVYRPSEGTFYLRNSNTTGLPDVTVPFGTPGGNDIPVVGDWDGNGTTTIGIYRPGDNTFYLRNTNDAGGADHIVVFGASGDVPVVGDWDGNGTTTVGLYRPSTSTFYLHNSNSVLGAVTPDMTLVFGASGDLPVAGHWGPLSNLPPVAVDDAVTTNAAAVLNGDVLAANPTTADSDPDGDPLTVVAVNGSAAGVGTQITLPTSNARLTLNADGTFAYDPNGTAATSDSFTYTISDLKGATASATVSVTLNPNQAPALTAGGTLSYTENQAAANIDTTVTVTDPDSANLTGATVVITGNCASGEDVLSFVNQNGITGTPGSCSLTLAGSSSVANYQAALRTVKYNNTSNNPSTAARTVTWQVDDGAASSNLSNTPTSTIDVTAVNSAPTLTAGATLGYTENQAATNVDTTIDVTDPDSANLTGATVQITGNCASGQDVLSFTNQNGITGTPGSCSMTLAGTSSIANYIAALRSVKYSNSSDNPSPLARTVTWQVNDGGAVNNLSNTATSTITVTAVNDAPVLAAGGTLGYTENQAATAIDTTITVTDADSANLVGATVQITGNCASGEDVLSFTNQNGISGTPGSCSLALSGSSSVANYVTALKSVKYSNTSENPSTAARTVTWQVNDGGAVNNLSNTATSTINVTAVNDPPVATGHTNLPAQAGIPITYSAGKLGGTDAEGTAVTINTTPDSLCAGCALTINADGGFTFTPPPSAAGTTVSFTYHVTDSGTPLPAANSAPATVSFAVAGPAIYFVKSSAVGSGNCTLANDCTLSTALASIGASTNARIFIGDSGSYATPVPLNSGGWLVGQGASGTTFDALFGISAPAQGTLAARPNLGQTRPTVQRTVTLNAGSTVRGLNLSTSSFTGLSGAGVSGVTVNEVNVTTTTGTAVNITGTGNGGTLTFGSITVSSATKGISVSNLTGSFTVTGAAGGGTGDLTSGGTITGGGSATRGAEFIGVTAGVSLAHMTFTNATQVDGGDPAVGSGNCGALNGGGTNTGCNSPIFLQDITGVTLDAILVDGSSQHGINGNNVTNFTLSNAEIRNTGTVSGENAIHLYNVHGNSSITASNIHDSFYRGMQVSNNTGTLPQLNIFGSTFSDNGAQGILLDTIHPATMTVNIGDGTAGNANSFSNNFSNAIQTLTESGSSANLTVNVNHNTFTRNNSSVVHQANSGTITASVLSTTNTSGGLTTGSCMFCFKADGGTLNLTVDSNTIGTNGVDGSGSNCLGCTGMSVDARTAGAINATIRGNTVQGVSRGAISVTAGQGSSTTKINLTLTGNLLRGPNPAGAAEAIYVQSGVLSNDTNCVTATIGGAGAGVAPTTNANAKNVVQGDWTTFSTFGKNVAVARKVLSGANPVLNLPGYSGSEATWVHNNNTLPGASPDVGVANTPYTSGATCP